MLDRKGPNPYLMAVFTALLTAIVTLTGNYFTSRAQMRQFLVQNQLNMRRSAYNSLLEKLNRVHSPALSTILNIGSINRHVTTDMEIEEFEGMLYELLQETRLTDLYWQLNSDLKIIRLNGSQEIQVLSEDLLKVLTHNYNQINMGKYPKALQDFYNEITKDEYSKDIINYAGEPRLHTQEIISIALLSRFFDNFVDTMRRELENIKE